ncbi:4Fe-4S binding protein [Desulfatitalea tepidiphila]|uniref:4Fe-4S binding protein n=1 Tax=Desulfatitalea tepidiphila TaxID=1185843 RepID=UPI0006B67766|nr:4Fe-4S binding protein [Desulfatitalea tepidiphila]
MQTVTMEVKNEDVADAIRTLLGRILALEEIDAVMVPGRLPGSRAVMPLLIHDPDQLDNSDPLSPAFALNAAKQVCRLTRTATPNRVAAVLRPCEIRAFIELVKLKQGLREQVIIIGSDCPGAYPNKVFDALTHGGDESGADQGYIKRPSVDEGSLSKACRACEHPMPTGADLAVCLWGVDTGREVMVDAQTDAGREILDRLGLKAAPLPDERAAAVETVVAERTRFRDSMFAETAAATDSLEKLDHYFAHCVNCYNCRTACPVCYCRQCVFETNLFDHDPLQYLSWTRRKGMIKMPTDTIFYHLTRLAHMSTACVGCGQCSNACPNDIDVMSLFRTVAHRTQAAFDYQAGRDAAERPPLSEFREHEFADTAGLHWRKEA